MSSDRPADEVFAECQAAKRIKEEDSDTTTSTSLFSKTQFQQQMVICIIHPLILISYSPFILQGSIAFEPLPTADSIGGSLYSYQDLVIDSYGPPVPLLNELEENGLVHGHNAAIIMCSL